MSQKTQARINQGLRLLHKSYRITFGDPRINVHNSLSHELGKCKLMYEMKKAGKQVLAECIFVGGGRCDVYIPEDFRVYEILCSETEEEALRKEDYYPSELDICYVKVNKDEER